MKYTKYVVGLVVVLVVIFFSVRFLNPAVPTPVTAVGDTSNSAKIAQIVLNGGSVATTTSNSVWGSLFNGDSTSRIVQDVYYSISGLETNIVVQLVVATSTAPTSTPTQAASLTTFNSGFLSTSTTMIYVSTSTAGAMGTAPGYRIWPSGTYLNFTASSTQLLGTTTTLTGSGIVGVKYVPGAN